MNSIKLQGLQGSISGRNSVELKKYFYFKNSKSCKSKNIIIKIDVGACLVLLGWFDR